MTKITEAQAGEYTLGIFAEYQPIIWSMAPGEDDTIDVVVHVKGHVNGFVTVTCWLENGQPYGEW